TPFFFYRNLLTGFVEAGHDFSIGKHANSFWDLQMCFMISPFALVDGIPTLLVTNEVKIRTAARDAGHGDYVLTFAEYREALQSCRLRALAEEFEARLVA